MFYDTPFRELEVKLYSITILRTVLCGENIWGVDDMYYKSILCERPHSTEFVWVEHDKAATSVLVMFFTIYKLLQIVLPSATNNPLF